MKNLLIILLLLSTTILLYLHINKSDVKAEVINFEWIVRDMNSWITELKSENLIINSIVSCDRYWEAYIEKRNNVCYNVTPNYNF